MCNLPKLRYMLIDPEIDTAGTTTDFFSQVAFPPEEFEEVALTKKKQGKAKVWIASSLLPPSFPSSLSPSFSPSA